MLSIKKLTLTGALLLVLLAAPLAVVNADINGLEPDDFFAGFNTSNWVADPLPEYAHNPAFFSKQTDGAESYLQIAVPGGTKRSLSASVDSLQAPRVMQAVTDDGRTPFTITVKFLGVPSTAAGLNAAIQGIVIKGTYSPLTGFENFPSYWRFSIDSTGTPNQIKPFSSWFYQSEPTIFGGYNDVYPTTPFLRGGNEPIWLRVERTIEQIGADYWSTFHYYYSLNGSTWTELIPRQQAGTGDLNRIRQTFVVTHVGVFAGTTGENPAYTAKVDWVSITSGAPANEDQGQQPTTFTLNTSVSPSGGGSISVSPQKATYNSGEQVTLTASANAGFLFQNWTVDGSTQSGNPLVLTMNANRIVRANFVPDVPVEFSEFVFLPMVMR